jgi:hypothetical protein
MDAVAVMARDRVGAVAVIEKGELQRRRFRTNE